MSLKKPALLLTSSGAISNTLNGCVTPLVPSPPCQCTRSRNSQLTYRKLRRDSVRAYSSTSPRTESNSEPPLTWPELGSPPRAPTPYEVFSQKKGEAYSKRRFYELVKLYHPDRYKHKPDSELSESQSQTVLTERYRLVIAANVILSDPDKKHAYDKYGAGWSSNTVADLWPSQWEKHKYSTKHRWREDGDKAYRWPPDQDPMFNATWEDWERWYRQQYFKDHPNGTYSPPRWYPNYFSSSRRTRRPIYASNHAFLSTVFILAALGGVGQATRAEEQHRSRTERTNIINEQTGRDLMQARQDAIDRRDSGETKEKRIKRFLSEHDSYEQGEFDGRAAREDDEGLCASGVVKDRDEPKFWQRPPPEQQPGQSSGKNR